MRSNGGAERRAVADRSEAIAWNVFFDCSCSSVPHVRSSAWLGAHPKQGHCARAADSRNRSPQTPLFKRALATNEDDCAPGARLPSLAYHPERSRAARAPSSSEEIATPSEDAFIKRLSPN